MFSAGAPPAALTLCRYRRSVPTSLLSANIASYTRLGSWSSSGVAPSGERNVLEEALGQGPWPASRPTDGAGARGR